MDNSVKYMVSYARYSSVYCNNAATKYIVNVCVLVCRRGIVLEGKKHRIHTWIKTCETMQLYEAKYTQCIEMFFNIFFLALSLHPLQNRAIWHDENIAISGI